jgi:hypothetical protein
MIRALFILIAVTQPAVAMATDIRPATEEEIETALQGCWVREITERELIARDRRNATSETGACFGLNGVATSYHVGGRNGFVEGFEGEGTYTLEDGKLSLSGRDWEGWIFGRAKVSCDVVMIPNVAMKLTNCIGSGRLPNGKERDAQVLDDTSFAFVPPKPSG